MEYDDRRTTPPQPFPDLAPLQHGPTVLLTIGALTVQGAVAEPQLRLAVRHAREAGATPREIAETIWQMSMFGGMPAMQKALEIAQSVFIEHEGKQAE